MGKGEEAPAQGTASRPASGAKGKHSVAAAPAGGAASRPSSRGAPVRGCGGAAYRHRPGKRPRRPARREAVAAGGEDGAVRGAGGL